MGYKNRQQQNDYQNRWLQARRRDWIVANGPCRTCGSCDDLEVDHIDESTKLLAPARIWGLRKDKREAELAKCQVLCSRCHRQKTTSYLARAIVHGTHDGYANHGCRCESCTTAQVEYTNANTRERRVRGGGVC